MSSHRFSFLSGRTAFIIGLLLSMTVWFGSRVYLHYRIEPLWHPMAKAYQDMAVSMDEGAPFGQINLSRVARNRDVKPTEVYKAAAMPGDEHCQYRTLDPGYGVVFAAARKIFGFTPDTEMRPVLLQIFFDFLLPFLLYVTFWRWGWFAATGSVILYSANAVFAASSVTAWTYFWDGLICILSLLSLLWLYRLARESAARWPKILLSILLGAILGAGIWLRSSWFEFGAMLLIMAAFSKTLRPWLIYGAVVFAIFAGGMFVRSSQLNGYPSMSTRMLWHTAMQGIGKYPNAYGIEDDDLYVFQRTYKESGTHFNYCNYNAHDRAVQKDVAALWHTDPGFIVRGIVQRIFSDVFLNFNVGNYQFWNYGMLALAWLGLLAGIAVGGDLGMFAVLSFAMYLLMNVSNAFVYYLFRQYSTPTQALLLLGTVALMGAIHKFIRQPQFVPQAFGRNRVTVANIGLIFSAITFAVIMSPPVQAYLTPHFPASLNADVPDDMGLGFNKVASPDDNDMAITGLLSQINHLPPSEKQALLDDAARTTHARDMRDFIKHYLEYFTYINLDGAMHPIWLAKRNFIDAHEALFGASRSIVGVGYQWIIGFDPGNPHSWHGNEIHFKLLENHDLPQARVDELLRDRFSDWGWKLARGQDGIYTATYLNQGCSTIRRELAKYYQDQCSQP